MRRAIVFVFLGSCAFPEKTWDPSRPPEPLKVEKKLPDGRCPIDLGTVLRLAGANNLEVAFVREKVAEAYAREKLAWERFVPVIGPEFTFRRHEGLTQGTDGAFVEVDKQSAFSAGRLRFRWEVGESIFAILASARRSDASLENLRGTENSIALAAGLAYYDLLREQVRARVLEDSVKASRKLEAELKVAVEAKRGFEGDRLRASVQATGAQISVERAREAAKIAGIRLATLLRLPPEIELAAVEEEPQPLRLIPPGPLPEHVGRALESRPELRAALAELTAARQDRLGATWGPLVPDIGVDLSWGGLGAVFGEAVSSRDYVVTLGWRIGPGGLFDLGRRDLEDSRVRQAEIRFEQVRHRVIEETRSAWEQLQARERMLALVRQEVRDAEEALRLNLERQAANIGLPLEVLQAEEALTRARVDFATVVIEYNQAQLRLMAAMGRKP